MRSFDVEVLSEAEAEAREAFLWYFDRSPIVADAFRDGEKVTILAIAHQRRRPGYWQDR